MAKIFIDTNIFLDFYRSNEEALEVLRELHKHSSSIVLPRLVYHEFIRNRSKILRAVIVNLKDEKPKHFTTAIIQNLPEFKGLKDARDKHKQQLEIIVEKLRETLEDPQKDNVFQEVVKLYESKTIAIYEHDDAIIAKAKKRQLLGEPPGTDRANICDEVIWETILANIDDDIIIIARDSTYKDNHYLLSREFEGNTKKKLMAITDKISKAIKLLGKEVSPEIEDLEDEQMKGLVWHSLGGVSISSDRLGGWDPNLSDYAWPKHAEWRPVGTSDALKNLIDTYYTKTAWLRRDKPKDLHNKLSNGDVAEGNDEDKKK